MSDNVFKLNFVREMSMKKKIIWMSVIAAAVCVIVLLTVFWQDINFDALVRSIKYIGVPKASEGTVFSFDAHSGNDYADYRDGLAIGSVSGLTVYSENGQLEHEKQTTLSAPKVLVSDRNILLYDVGGYSFSMTGSDGKTVLDTVSEKPILDADISPDGCCCYCAPETGYKSVLCVYSDNGSLLYRYNSSSRYLPLCTVSKNAKYAAAVAFSQLDGAFQSFAVVFKTDQKEPLYTIALGNQLIFDIEFMPDNTLVCFGEDSLRWMEADGTLLGNYNYSDAYLKGFSTLGDGFLTLCLNTNKAGNHYSIVTISREGDVLGKLSIEGELLDFSVNGKYIAVLTSQSADIYTRSLELYASDDRISGITDIVMRKDGSALLLNTDSGAIFRP